VRRLPAVIVVFMLFLLASSLFGSVVSVSYASRTIRVPDSVPLEWRSLVYHAMEKGILSPRASDDEAQDWLGSYLQGKLRGRSPDRVNPFGAKRVAAAEMAGATVVSTDDPPAYVGTGKILVLLVEFSGTDVVSARESYTGPLHNGIPMPSPENNVDYWVPDFDRTHYQRLLFDRTPGALTLANYYEEQSYGLFTVDGFVSAWVRIDRSEWFYGADGASGIDNLNGPVWRLVVDAVYYANQQYPGQIPWADFDTDGDGWVDSLMVIHAGMGQESGGGAQGDNAIWSHSWFTDWPNGVDTGSVSKRGVPIKVGPYTTEPEDGAVGVFAHEYAHQLGLPDEYDRTYLGDAGTAFWTLMSMGSWGPGPAPLGRTALGTMPSHMNVWDKFVLGWLGGRVKYLSHPVSDKKFNLGQVETKDGLAAVKVELPTQTVTLTINTPHSPTHEWWSGSRPDTGSYSTYTSTRSFDFTTAAAPITLTFWEWYEIETDWDYGWVQASTDGGSMWTSLPGKYTTNTDPNGNNPGNGITGVSGGWVQEAMDLSAYAGSNILLRFRYTQDQYITLIGWTIDDITVKSDTNVIFSDSVETGANGWTVSGTDSLSGWSIIDGSVTRSYRHYYIMEWRNFVGFDRTLANVYNWLYGRTVEFYSYNPGLLIWYRNFAYEDNDVGLHPGAGFLLPADAHPKPLLTPTKDYWRQRVQVQDATFGLRQTISNTLTYGGRITSTYPSLDPSPEFSDATKYFYSQWKGGRYQFTGVKIPTYGLRISVLEESAGLSGSTLRIYKAS